MLTNGSCLEKSPPINGRHNHYWVLFDIFLFNFFGFDLVVDMAYI